MATKKVLISDGNKFCLHYEFDISTSFYIIFLDVAPDD